MCSQRLTSSTLVRQLKHWPLGRGEVIHKVGKICAGGVVNDSAVVAVKADSGKGGLAAELGGGLVGKQTAPRQGGVRRCSRPSIISALPV